LVPVIVITARPDDAVSDNRNHVLDDLLRDGIMVLVAKLIGVAPGQFVAVVACTQLLESLAHANLRLWFGPIGERLLVSRASTALPPPAPQRRPGA
jgi:sterol desaturase/sphingolipid hydroxylase (fatty acid hydroxylase superfamily)